jgi:hypothetical protein
MRRMIMPLRYVSSLAAPYALTRRHIADFAWLWIPGIESDKSKQTIQICVVVRDA